MLKKSRLLWVNKIFGPTHQGEGPTAGELTMFVRLGGCNLACEYCDAPKTWNGLGSKFKHPEKYNLKEENRWMSLDDIIDELKRLGPDVKKIIISGGEPMLQQRNLIILLRKLRLERYISIEVETNGTVKPEKEFMLLVDQFNCSPKTSNSGPDNKPEMREKPEALRKFAAYRKTNFKFVSLGEQDSEEIQALVAKYNMKRVALMPMARTPAELDKVQTGVAGCALRCRYNYSPRLHVDLWDNAEDK